MPFLEDMKVGLRRELGTFTFTAETIKIFAREFDPQPFHLDEEAGRNSLFGGLVASGWHVASVCMKLIVADGVRARQEAEARRGIRNWRTFARLSRSALAQARFRRGYVDLFR